MFLEQLTALHDQLKFYGQLEHLADSLAFAQHLDPVRHLDWVVYAKRPFSGPQAVLAYLSLYTHRVAISNRRLVAYDHDTVTLNWKDYRAKGHKRYTTMTLATDKFIRRFLIHILPQGFHRIRHFGLFANHQRKQNLKCIRRLLGEVEANPDPQEKKDKPPTFVCRTCGTPMVIIEILPQRHRTRAPP